MQVVSDTVALNQLVLQLKRRDLVVLRRVCSCVAGANPDGSRSVTDKFVSLIDARDPTVQEEAAVLPLSDPNVVIVFTD